MQKNSNIDNKEKEINLEEENKDSKKKKIAILLVAILILSLITTGLTTNIFGRIGTAFRNEGDFALKHTDDNDKETIRNQELKFDSNSLKISLSDTSGKLSYSRNRVIPAEYTCETDDAKIATCYPADGYVVVYPKGVGKTTITLRGEANGKIYAATSEVIVGEAERYIELSSNNGSINLYNNKIKEVSYYLVGMSGNVKATSSDESVAKVSVSKGVLKIEASKVGTTKITVSIDYNNQSYTSVYNLEVINENSDTGSNDKTTNKKKSKISTLSKLSASSGELKFNPSINNYSIVVDESIETIDIDYVKTNANAKVIYTIDGIASTSLKNIPLRDGAKEIVLTVISEDGSSTTSYKIAINRVDSDMLNSINSIKVNGMVLSATTDNTYTAKVGSDVDKVDLSLSLNDSNTNVEFVVNDKISGGSEVVTDLDLKLGKNNIKMIIRNKFGISMIYYVTIERDTPSKNTDINLDILDDGYELTQDDDNNYSINNIPYEKDNVSLSAACVDSDCKNISYEITYEDGTKKSLDDLNNVPLKEGNNKIAITVVAEDGKTTDTHYVNIYKPIRTINFIKDKNEVLVENAYTDIYYEIKETAEDGTVTTIELDNPEDVIRASLEKYGDDVTLEVYQGFIRVIPKDQKKIVGNSDTLKLTYNEKEATTKLNFDIDEYQLSSGSKEFDMSNSKQENTRTIILNTDLVESTDTTLSIESSEDGKKLTICDKDKVKCVVVEVDKANDAGDITLSYGKDSVSEIGPNDLPITITAHGDGKSQIKVSGTVYDKSIDKDFTITINVTRKYAVTIYANIPGEDTGKFTIASKVWNDEISKEEALDLSLIPEPYKVVDCEYYKFKHYTTNLDTKELTYDRDAKKMVDGSTLTDDLDIYAIYEDDPTEEEIPETNSLWLKASDYAEGLPLFHNEDYYSKYNEDKVIYPGAQGSYVMNFTAEDAMTLTGMVLKEKNICVKDKCLNMGYMVHYNEIRRADGTYTAVEKDLFGQKSNNDYWILNQKYDTIHNEVTYLDSNQEKQTLDTENRVNITFDEEINLNSGDQISITIFWKWVEVDDVADTTIGNYAAEDDNSINDKYGLYVGLVYSPNNTCPTD